MAQKEAFLVQMDFILSDSLLFIISLKEQYLLYPLIESQPLHDRLVLLTLRRSHALTVNLICLLFKYKV